MRMRSLSLFIILASLIALSFNTVYASNTLAKCNEEFKCGYFSVPLNYQDKGGKSIKIAYAYRVISPTKPTIFLNPGGPGGSGVNYLLNYKSYFSPEFYNNFNLIGIDTRGSNLSNPLRCLSNHEEDLLNEFNPTLINQKNYLSFKNLSSIVYKKCYMKYGNDLQFYNLDNIVNDFQTALQYFKLSKFNYLGKSYGAAIGVRFAQLYPDSIGNVVIDGLPNVNLNLEGSASAQSSSINQAYLKYINYLVKRDTIFGSSSDKVIKKVNNIYNSLSKPVKIDGSKYAFDQTAFISSLIGSLYQGHKGYDSLTNNLLEASKGNYNNLFRVAQGLIGRDAAGNYSDMVDYAYIITCQSVPHGSLDGYLAGVSRSSNNIFASYNYATFIPCLSFPEPKLNLKTSKASVLIASNLYDPITAHSNALKARSLLPNSILLTNNGDSHTVFHTSSSCSDKIILAYFKGEKIADSNCLDDR